MALLVVDGVTHRKEIMNFEDKTKEDMLADLPVGGTFVIPLSLLPEENEKLNRIENKLDEILKILKNGTVRARIYHAAGGGPR